MAERIQNTTPIQLNFVHERLGEKSGVLICNFYRLPEILTGQLIWFAAVSDWETLSGAAFLDYLLKSGAQVNGTRFVVVGSKKFPRFVEIRFTFHIDRDFGFIGFREIEFGVFPFFFGCPLLDNLIPHLIVSSQKDLVIWEVCRQNVKHWQAI